MKKTLLLTLFCFTSFFLFAQQPNKTTLKGTLADSTGTELAFATVMLLEPKDSALINFTRSDDKANFEFKNIRNRDYLLKISYVGFIPYQSYVVASGNEINDLGKIILKPITKDFRKMIQSDKFLYIKINFISFERVPKYETSEENFMGKLTVTLADVAVPSDVKCNIIKDEKNLIHLRGKRDYKFSDFNLKPPTRMLGAIKVDENITVNFHLVLYMK